MEAVHCSCRTNCNTRHCSWKKIKIWLLHCLCRLKISIMYQCDTWSWIRVRIDVALHRHFQNYLPVNVVKFYIFPVLIMVNSTYHLVLRGANTMCVRGEWDLRSNMGFVGQPNTLLQCTRLDSSKSQTVGAVEYFRIVKKFLTVVLHSICLKIFNQGGLFRNLCLK